MPNLLQNGIYSTLVRREKVDAFLSTGYKAFYSYIFCQIIKQQSDHLGPAQPLSPVVADEARF
jgi:hypothetical protein